ncbi:hypothetical protein JKG68_25280 [Microvirga aerilata]|uniref:Uncharacterized protein n=2 Tax=Microvirga aerilata TaxID=670292 RepID=A0A936ZCE4_9HYPH|nr:hypothetical protein [Microvirga aerilata]MBL0407246.1 hypothetical protein [Microvirga aerilata]
MKAIRKQKDFYEWLTWYMQNTGPTRLYPKPVADFAEFLIVAARTGLDKMFIDKHFGGGGGGLQTLFKQLCEGKQQVECRTRFVDCAILIYEETFYYDVVSVRHANWLCVLGLELEATRPSVLDCFGPKRPPVRGYFQETPDDGSAQFISTRKFERKFGLKVALPDWGI